MDPVPVGSRVRIRPTSGVASYLHGAEGAVIELRFSNLADRVLSVVLLDEPRAPTPHWGPIKQIGLAPNELEVI